jgi:hypothetical protein
MIEDGGELWILVHLGQKRSSVCTDLPDDETLIWFPILLVFFVNIWSLVILAKDTEVVCFSSTGFVLDRVVVLPLVTRRT